MRWFVPNKSHVCSISRYTFFYNVRMFYKLGYNTAHGIMIEQIIHKSKTYFQIKVIPSPFDPSSVSLKALNPKPGWIRYINLTKF